MLNTQKKNITMSFLRDNLEKDEANKPKTYFQGIRDEIKN